MEVTVGKAGYDRSSLQIDLSRQWTCHPANVRALTYGNELPIANRSSLGDFASRIQRDDLPVVEDEVRSRRVLRKQNGAAETQHY